MTKIIMAALQPQTNWIASFWPWVDHFRWLRGGIGAPPTRVSRSP